MADSGLRVVIGADMSEVVTELKKLTDSLGNVSPAATQAASGLNKIPQAARGFTAINDRMRTGLRDAAGAFQDLNSNLNTVGNTLKKVPAGANQAANALTNVGRVAQDLPFGFVGIQNNLNPLLESFQRLKAETGSGKAALAALGQSLIGAGGIGLALSVASSAFLIFQNGIAGFNSKTKEAKEASDDLAKTLKSIASIQAEAAASVEGQISQVNALASAVSDTNKSYSERKRALEELKEVNKSYFGDLKLEDTLTSKLASTVTEYANALVNSAIQKQFIEEISNVAKKVAESDEAIKKSRDQVARANTDVTEAEKKLSAAISDRISNESQSVKIITLTDNLKQAKIRLSDAEGELAGKNETSTKLLEQEAIVRDSLNKTVFEGLKFKDLDADKSKKEQDALKKRIEALKDLQSLTGLTDTQQVELAQLEIKLAKRDAVKNGFTKDELQQQIQGILEKAFPVGTFVFDTVVTTRVNDLEPSQVQKPKPLSEGQVKDIAKATGLDTIEISAPKFVFKNLGISKEEALAQLNKSLEDISKGIQVEAFSTIGEAIGAALSGGDVSKVFDNFINFLGDGLQQLGKALISYGIALSGFKLAIKSLDPAVALIAGVGAIAAGSLVKASLPKFADGGIVTGPVIGQIGEMHKPEVIMPLDRLKSLIGSAHNDIGSGTQLIPIINNEGLYLAMKRGERSAGRKF